jgi:carboxyl-terminal processing protease
VKRAGVGLVLAKRFGFVQVVGAIPNSPAAKVGLGTGDMIESIKGVATRDMPLAYASMLLDGEAGTTVELSVVRMRRPEPQAIKLVRANLSLPQVESKMLADQVGYINIDALAPAQVKEVSAAVKKLQQDGARKLIVDVRNCSVGSPEDGIALSNLFMDKGRITYLQGQRVPRQDFDADPAKAITTLPVAVLTNTGTAGGAEVMAAALMGNKRAQVVGLPTYGAAAMHKAVSMEDGGAIILSVAKYYSPDGKAIQDTRVMPQTPVAEPEPPADFDENGEPLANQPDQEPQPKKATEEDPVVKKALEVLAKG